MGSSTKKMVDLFLIAAVTIVGGCSFNTNGGYYEEPTPSSSTISPAPTLDKPDTEEYNSSDYYEDDSYYENDYNSTGGMIYGIPSKNKTSGNMGMSSGTRGGIGSSGSISGG